MNLNNQIQNFNQYLSTQSKSPNTITSYISDLNHYFNLHSTINRTTIQLYKSQISHLAATSFNRKLSSLKQFNEYLVSTNTLPEVYIYKQDFIRIQNQGNPTNITEKTVLKFLDRVNTKHAMYKSRNIAIIYLMANTGIRREECCNMKLSNIDLRRGEMTFIGKGNKERTVALNKKAIEVIQNYLEDRKNHKNVNSPYLFLSERGEKLTRETINDIFDHYCTPKCKVTPHDLRHNYCTTMIEKNILTPKQVQNQAGHSSILTTDRYTHARIDSIKSKISDFSIG